MKLISRIYKAIMPKKTAKKSKTTKKKSVRGGSVSGGKAAPKRTKAQKKTKTPKPIGSVTHFFGDIGVAIVKFKKAVKAGTKVQFKGATTDFEETIKSMQYNHKPIAIAPKGKEVGIKVRDKVREGDEVFEVK